MILQMILKMIRNSQLCCFRKSLASKGYLKWLCKVMAASFILFSSLFLYDAVLE